MIDWSTRQLLGAGAYGNVYKIGDNAVKVGYISHSEADRQALMYEYGIALPVLGYDETFPIPEEVARELCHIHGVEYKSDKVLEYLAAYDGKLACICDLKHAAVLSMPLVSTDIKCNPAHFMRYVEKKSLDLLDHKWDRSCGRNVGMYNNLLVALDWGVSIW